jgi:hypothetical protein
MKFALPITHGKSILLIENIFFVLIEMYSLNQIFENVSLIFFNLYFLFSYSFYQLKQSSFSLHILRLELSLKTNIKQ